MSASRAATARCAARRARSASLAAASSSPARCSIASRCCRSCGQRAAVFGDPLLVDSGERGDGAHRAREFTDAVHVKQQARIPAAAPFVDVDEPDFQIGKLRGALLVNDRQPLRRLLQRCLRPGDGGIGRRDLFGGDVALNFELTKITEDRARLRGETIRFACNARIRSSTRRASASVALRSALWAWTGWKGGRARRAGTT